MAFFDRNLVSICLLTLILSLVVLPVWAQILVFFIGIIIAWRGDRFFVTLLTLPRDARHFYRFWKVMRLNHLMKTRNDTPASLLSARAAISPDSPCLIFQGRVWTTKQVEEYSWQVAHVFSQLGFKHGDVVALMCTNCPEFIAIWLGLSRLGVITACINTNLRQDPLRHCLSIASPRAIIASTNLCSAVGDIWESLEENCKLLQLYISTQQPQMKQDGFSSLSDMLKVAKTTPIDGLAPPDYHNILMYIYTSGTTGLPKAAVVKSSRYLFGSIAGKYFLGLSSKDRIYNPLPLYHSSGGILGTGPAVVFGVPCVLREKFSATAYWKDCAENGCTIGQYIGEMCRYMLVTPPSDWDRKHKVKMLVGNGLRPSIWKQFTKRFNIRTIVELYATTEGNVNIVNVDGTVGAVGFVPNLVPPSMVPYGLVKVDPQTKEFIRDADNLCVRCKPDEPGMLVGIIKEGEPTQDYHGYVDPKASKKNITENVFSLGDKAFVTGDILVMDEKGYLYFKDRTGDTFRWKGENVSTCEVESAISAAIGLRDVCVYGVAIPGNEGRAGMATIVDKNNTLDLVALGKALAKSLPSYAQPLFLRVTQQLEMTGTFKLKKTDLLKEGYNPSTIKDKLYFRSNKDCVYQELTKEIYLTILEGYIKI